MENTNLNLKNSGFTHRQTNPTEFKNSIEEKLFYAAKSQDANALFTIGITALNHNRIGFAWAFCKSASQKGYKSAKKCVSILEDTTLDASARLEQCLSLFDESTKKPIRATMEEH